MQVEKTKFNEEKPVYAYDQLCCGDVFTWGGKVEAWVKINETLMFDPNRNETANPSTYWGYLGDRYKWPVLTLCESKLLIDGLC